MEKLKPHLVGELYFNHKFVSKQNQEFYTKKFTLVKNKLPITLKKKFSIGFRIFFCIFF